MDGVPVTRRALCPQLETDAQDTAMGAPIILLRRLETNNITVTRVVSHLARSDNPNIT